jgi:hypothetical protein
VRTDVCLLDHAHVVGAVADAERDAAAALYQVRDQRLLLWRHAAAQHRHALLANLHASEQPSVWKVCPPSAADAQLTQQELSASDSRPGGVEH